MKQFKVITIVLILLSLTLLIAGCGAKTDPKANASETPSVPVKVHKVATGKISNRIAISGKISPVEEIAIIPKIPGRVAAVPFDIGQQVKKGEVVLRLESTDIAAQVAQAEAGLALAQASYAKQKAGTRPEQVEMTRAQVAQAQANFSNAEVNYTRMKNLFTEGAIAQKDLDGAKLQYDLYQAQLTSAKEQLRIVQTGETTETFKISQAQVRQAQATVDLARVSLANAVVLAPLAGVISQRNIDPGEMASPALTALSIVNLQEMRVEGNVAEADINHVRVGQEVTVKIDTLGNAKFTGKIVMVSPVADTRSKAYPIKVTIPNSDGALKPGMFATVEIVTASRSDALVVPADAVVEKSGAKVVYVAQDGKAMERAVEIGLSDEGQVEIKQGLKAGEYLVVAGQQLLNDQTPLIIKEDR